ncbi:entericidin A/B family lipoprotein [Marinobacterium lutimaris]|uniref:Predicted small secreted protein n=1 Tax=Marinobacterium lutimaris TaxID=568106 RepID=A0A1H5X7J1_9GAMM|nr:entericidin A/B family lipoprotein [Marinobacterium lutimaris]SEG07711.1 Predicted small secreted protein [Marinobacterium lutimaris]
MKKRMISPLLALMLVFAGGFALSGCNTIEGAGKDIEKAGQKIEDAADRDG